MKDIEALLLWFLSSLILLKSSPIQVNQLNRRSGRRKTFIVQLSSSSISHLGHILCRNDAKQQRHAGFQTRLANSARSFPGYVFKVGRLSANDYAQTNHGVELL